MHTWYVTPACVVSFKYWGQLLKLSSWMTILKSRLRFIQAVSRSGSEALTGPALPVVAQPPRVGGIDARSQ